MELLTWPYPVPAADVAVHLVFDGNPCSKARPRFGKGHAFNTDRTTAYEKALGVAMAAALKSERGDAESRFAIRCFFFRANRQRIDADNLLKSVSDAANRLVFRDDSQVSEIMARVFLASERPRSEIVIFRIEDPNASPKCLRCGVLIKSYRSYQRKFCSTACWSATHRTQAACAFCEKEFTLPLSQLKASRCCSRSCAMKLVRRRKHAHNGRHLWVCSDCGGSVSRKEYKRCRSCVYAAREGVEPKGNGWRLRQLGVMSPEDIKLAAQESARQILQQRANEAAQPELFTNATAKQEVRPRAVLPEPLQQRINRLARPAVISPRREPDDEGPKGAA